MSSTKRLSARDRLRIPKPDERPSTPGAKSRNRESAKPRPELIKVGVQLVPDLYYDLKKKAVSERRKLYEVLNEAIAQYLGRKE